MTAEDRYSEKLTGWIQHDNEDTTAISAEFSVTPQDPLAVSLLFRLDPSPASPSVLWEFSRELLRDGLRNTQGDGDVCITPSWPAKLGCVMITLSSPDGACNVSFSRVDLNRFDATSRDIIPIPDDLPEDVMDAAIAQLLT